MLRRTIIASRRGQPTPRRGDKNPNVPAAHRPFQGGQQFFQSLLLARANDAAARELRQQQQQQRGVGIGGPTGTTGTGARASGGASLHAGDAATGSAVDPRVRFPEQNVAFSRGADRLGSALDDVARDDGFVSQRTFNERDFYERIQAEAKAVAAGAGAAGGGVTVGELSGSSSAGGVASSSMPLPRSVDSADEFEESHGYSLIKKGVKSDYASTAPYSSLDLWSEMPTYSAGTYFLYLIARRRNAYAVIFDASGKRVMPVYSVGNRGLKDSDKGFRVEGSAENAHQVTSQYLSDVLPKLREIEHAAGRPLEKGAKVPLVVRVLGFYNGRQGAIRALTDHSDAFEAKHIEDVTPFPLNGPKMPKVMIRPQM